MLCALEFISSLDLCRRQLHLGLGTPLGQCQCCGVMAVPSGAVPTCRMTQCPCAAATSSACSATTSWPCPSETLWILPLSMVKFSFLPERGGMGSFC